MTPELECFHSLISGGCYPEEKKALKKADFEQSLHQLKQEKDTAQKNIFRQYFSLGRDDAARYVVQQQKALLWLANSLLEHMSEEDREQVKDISAEPSQGNLCKSIYAALEEILFFMEKNFRASFDQDEPLPELYRQVAVREFVQKEIILRKRMQEIGIPEDLLRIGFMPVQEVIANKRGEGMSATSQCTSLLLNTI